MIQQGVGLARSSESSTRYESHEPMLITQNGEAKLVLMGVKNYERQEQTLALLKILALGNREIEQGKFEDIENVFTTML